MVRTRTRAASRGSIGGASGDSGVEYRRGVAAYAAAYGLAGEPLLGLEIAASDARVNGIILETDAAVDDIRITFNSGWIADIQAKRTLRKGAVFEKAVAQWAEAGRAGVDPTQHRLVIASGKLSGPMEALRHALDRRRLHAPGAFTKAEAEMLGYLDDLLGSLTAAQRNLVLNAAVIWEVAVEEPEHAGAREAIAHLGNAGVPVAEGEAGRAWEALCSTAGRLARQRGGHDLAGWLNALRAVGLTVEDLRNTPAGDLERRRLALGRYAERLIREARELDLRALGAELPPLTLADADAGVKVGTDPDDDRQHTDLMWALLRRHRVVLTGLPGSGKSTAVRQACGQLANRLIDQVKGDQPGDPAYPFPVRASLKQINALEHGLSFRDRMIGTAIRDDSEADREVLKQEIEARLDGGQPIALFLDALDETYDDRSAVVSEVERFLAGLPDSACVLIATRDIAYGQAATLGWADLRLLTPENVDTVIRAVLEAAAEHREIPDGQRSAWLQTRLEWVSQVLSQDRALIETPLIPTLLALLAVERPLDRLPIRRAEVLEAVVTDVMQRHEAPRQGSRPLQNLTGNSIGTAAMHAYATEATTILDSGGVATIVQVTTAVAETLAEMWGLAPAPAQRAAQDAIRFLDETGVFVLSEPDGTVMARLSLFAEIGDAVHVIQHPELAGGWVTRRISSRQVDSVGLAAALDETVNGLWQAELTTRTDDIELARAMVRAHREGTSLTDATIDRLRERLIISIGRGDRDGWSDWSRLMYLGVPDALADQAIAAAAGHSSTHELLARAAIALADGVADLEPDDEARFLDLLAVRGLPMSANEHGRPSWDGNLAGTLTDIQTSIAGVLLDRGTPGVVEVIRERALKGSRGLNRALLGVLRERGYDDVADAVDAEQASGLLSGLRDWAGQLDFDRYAGFLTLVADHDHAELTTRQRVELGELGDFAETLDMNDMGVTTLYDQTDDFLRGLIDLACVLFGYERAVLAAQAQVVLDRIATDTSHEVFYSLFDTAEASTETDWASVRDPDAAVDLLVQMYYMSLTYAWFATSCLWGSEIASRRAEPILRDALTRLDDYPRHQDAMAAALASFPTSPEPATWEASPNSVLRRVAARMCVAVQDGRLTQQLETFLADEDGLVREAAVEVLATTDVPDLESRLEHLGSQESPGWRCWSCSHNNPPRSRSCRGDGCRLVGPDPAERAGELLEELRHNRREEA